MDSPKKILKNIEKWAKNHENIRVMVLFGSRVQKSKADQLSDINLALFVRNPKRYFEDDTWYKSFGNVWLAVHKQMKAGDNWKILYDSGLLIEFIISPNTILEEFGNALPKYFNPGYEVLIDKNKISKDLPKANGTIQPPEKPSQEDFQNTVSNFWMNAYHVAKYLWRMDLWRVKHHDRLIKDNLLEMMGWHALLIGEKDSFSTYEGKDIKSWIDPETFTSLMTTYGRFYPADSWRALEDTIKLFSKLSNEVGKCLDADPQLDLKNKFLRLIRDLQSKPKE